MEKIKKINLKVIFIIFSIVFLLPSVMFMIKEKTVAKLQNNLLFFIQGRSEILSMERTVGAICFLLIMSGLMIVYFMLIKNCNKIFTKKFDVAKFILIISLIFVFILPLTSTDVFYYIATGWSEAKYGINPYYTSVYELSNSKPEEVKEDEILQKMPEVWKDTTIVYGPAWPFICKILSGLSMGNLTVALFIYKMFNLMLHLLNCYLIYKISRKKVFALIYGINPMILFEGLCNVHNDILAVMLILLALYFFVRKKQMFPTVICLAIATAVKYYAILLIPFLVIYYYRKEKVLKRILYASFWAIIFIAVVALCYLLYMEDLTIFKGISVQQNKFACSLFLVIYLKISPRAAVNVSRGLMLAFIIIYIYTIMKFLFKKNIKFVECIRTYSNLLILFIFGTITNFSAWYTMWPYSTIMWQKEKNINRIINISFATQISYTLFLLFGDSYYIGEFFYINTVLLIIIFNLILNYTSKKELKSYGTNIIN